MRTKAGRPSETLNDGGKKSLNFFSIHLPVERISLFSCISATCLGIKEKNHSEKQQTLLVTPTNSDT